MDIDCFYIGKGDWENGLIDQGYKVIHSLVHPSNALYVSKVILTKQDVYQVNNGNKQVVDRFFMLFRYLEKHIGCIKDWIKSSPKAKIPIQRKYLNYLLSADFDTCLETTKYVHLIQELATFCDKPTIEFENVVQRTKFVNAIQLYPIEDNGKGIIILVNETKLKLQQNKMMKNQNKVPSNVTEKRNDRSKSAIVQSPKSLKNECNGTNMRSVTSTSKNKHVTKDTVQQLSFTSSDMTVENKDTIDEKLNCDNQQMHLALKSNGSRAISKVLPSNSKKTKFGHSWHLPKELFRVILEYKFDLEVRERLSKLFVNNRSCNPTLQVIPAKWLVDPMIVHRIVYMNNNRMGPKNASLKKIKQINIENGWMVNDKPEDMFNDTRVVSLLLGVNSKVLLLLPDKIRNDYTLLSKLFDDKTSNFTMVQCSPLSTTMFENHVKTNNLTYLELEEQRICDEGAVVIGELLKVNKTLKEIDLHGNDIHDKGAAAIGKALEFNTKVMTLHLYDNFISDKGAIAIGNGLAKNEVLVELSLYDNSIGDLGGQAIGNALSKNSSLAELSLGCNKISDIGATAIGKALCTNASLRELYLDDNKIGDSGLIEIVEGLKTNQVISYLGLYENKISDTGAFAIADVLRVNVTLHELGLYGNKISIDGVSEIVEALDTSRSLDKILSRQKSSELDYTEIFTVKNGSVTVYL